MTFTKTTTAESSFEQTSGITIGASVETEASIPFIESATVELSAEVETSWSYGSTNSVS